MDMREREGLLVPTIWLGKENLSFEYVEFEIPHISSTQEEMFSPQIRNTDKKFRRNVQTGDQY